MDPIRQGPRLDGMLGVVGRLLAPAEVVSGRLTSLLGILWLTGGLWVVAAWALGVYDEGWRRGVLSIGITAIVVGVALMLLRDTHLGTTGDLLLTLLGSAAISLVVLWAGDHGVGVSGTLYVYVACFAAVSLRRQAAVITVASAGMHLVALLVGDYDTILGIWVLTWGTAIVASLVLGAAVEWLRQLVALLEEADEHRTRFVATVSHELRTPLTAILGSSETLQRSWHELDDSHRRRFIGVIDRQARRQLRLVEDVLTLSTLMRGSIIPTPERIDIEPLVRDLCETLPFPVTLDIPDQLTLQVDPIHLERILGNLLVNADRYGAQPILVRATAHEDEAHLEVVDHGTGIRDELHGRILEPFTQGDSGDRRSSAGVGLGLTICRELLEANNGELRYEHTPGGGATFRIVIPAA